MKTIKLANGIIMPQFGLGTFKVTNGEQGVDVVLNALKLGYRHIDTAKVYQNELEVGLALKESGIPRAEVFITTKIKEHYNGDDQKIINDIEDSLTKLGGEYIDLMLIHWPDHVPELNAKLWRILEQYYESGKIKAIGVSNFQIHHIEDLKKTAKIMPMVNQVEMHPGLQQLRLQQYCDSLGIVITSYGPFMKGLVYEDEYEEVLAKIAKKHNCTIAQVVIAWGLARNVIMIPKSQRLERLKENLDAVEIKLDAVDLKEIKALNRGNRVYTDPDNHPFFPFLV